MAPALHGTIVVDVGGFGDVRRTNTHQVNVRTALYRIVAGAFARSGVDWAGCHHEDRPWVADDHAAAGELIELCARLPLALGVVAWKM